MKDIKSWNKFVVNWSVDSKGESGLNEEILRQIINKYIKQTHLRTKEHTNKQIKKPAK